MQINCFPAADNDARDVLQQMFNYVVTLGFISLNYFSLVCLFFVLIVCC